MATPDPKPSALLDAAVGLAAITAGAAITLTRGMVRAATPLGRVLLHPPMVDERLHPARVVDALAGRGREVMASPQGDFERIVARIVPAVVDEVLDALDLNALIRERIDLIGLVTSADIAEIIDRIDIDAVVRQVDLDAVIQRVDLDAVLQRIDLDVAVQRVDMDAIAGRIDLDALAERIDLDRIVARIDVVGLTEQVLNAVDLPEIIRDSSGSVASQVVRDARIRGVGADEAIARVADRLFRRQRGAADPPGGRLTNSALITGDGAKP